MRWLDIDEQQLVLVVFFQSSGTKPHRFRRRLNRLTATVPSASLRYAIKHMHMTFTEAAAMFLLTKFPCITCVDEISRLQSLVVGKAGTSKLQVSEPT